jgi:hypothetical protein
MDNINWFHVIIACAVGIFLAAPVKRFFKGVASTDWDDADVSPVLTG